MSVAPLFKALEQAFRCLPGIGPRSATRMALHVLERDRERAQHLAQTLIDALERLAHCERCHNLTEQQPCGICRDPNRDASVLCVVSSPGDILAIEQSGLYGGHYHCLQGLLSPLEGLGPEEIGLAALFARVTAETPSEVVIALASTVEGEATTHQIVSHLKGQTRLTRLAQGVPVGGELDHIDASTLSQALASRTELGR